MSCIRYDPIDKNITISTNSYEGIPYNFLYNFIVYLVLFLIFLFLRKRTWNYTDVAKFNNPIDVMDVRPIRESIYNSLENVNQVVKTETCYSCSTTNIIYRALPLFVKMSDEELHSRCGEDAVLYCKFQRRLMLIGLVMMILSMTIILPLNLNGGLLSNDSSQFSSLTIANIGQQSNLTIVHLCMTVLLMLFVFFLSNRFIKCVDANTKDRSSSTLMVKTLSDCDETTVEQHFKEAYPLAKVLKVQQTYGIEELFNIYVKKVIAEEALTFCYDLLESHKERILVNPKCCGRLRIMCKCHGKKSQLIDGIDYYTSEVNRLTELFLNEKSKILVSKKLPIFFVTFENLQQALMIRREYIFQNYCCIKRYPKSQSSLSKELKSEKWKVVFSSLSKDILWQNLHKHGWRLWVPIILVNIAVITFVIMLSTPAIVIQTFNSYSIQFEKIMKIQSNIYLSQMLPSLVMVLVSALMPFLVCWANDISAHWTKTKQNVAVMNKLFAVLTTTILILPSLGLTSIPKLIPLLSKNSTYIKAQLNCIFMTDGGALFCNYLITATFIGMGIEMLRLGDFFIYIFKLLFSSSKAENGAIAKSLLWEFQFGINYAWTLSLFCILSTYAVIVPLVTPFGLSYLVSKHCVDRYNMIHVNIKTNVENDVHANAAKLMNICLIFTQATITAFVYLRRETVDALVICSFTAFTFGIVLITGRIFQRSLFKMAVIKYSDLSNNDTKPILNPTLPSSSNVSEVNCPQFVPPQFSHTTNVGLIERISRMSSIASNDK